MLLRCDAGTEMGAGHFFRCLALAEHARARGIDARLVVASPPDSLMAQAASAEVPVVGVDAEPASGADAEALVAIAADRQSQVVLVDGYHFSTDYYRRLAADLPRQTTRAALVDMPHRRFPVDVLINVNLGADPRAYDAPGARLLFGVEYTLLRRQFLEARRALDANPRPTPERVERLLVMLGGGDPTGETIKVLEGLRQARYQGEVDVVVGPSNPHGVAIEQAAEALEAEARILRNVTAMAELMSRQDLAICAGGGVAWELCCMGLPFSSILVAENQRETAVKVSEHGISQLIGWHDEIDAADIGAAFREIASDVKRRRAMRGAAMALIDGRGAERVLDALFAR